MGLKAPKSGGKNLGKSDKGGRFLIQKLREELHQFEARASAMMGRRRQVLSKQTFKSVLGKGVSRRGNSHVVVDGRGRGVA